MAEFYDIEDRPWWMVWKKPEPEPLFETVMVLGMPLFDIVIAAGTVILVGAILIYRPRWILGFLREMFGELLPRFVAVLFIIAVITVILVMTEGAPVLVAVGAAVVVAAIVVIGSIFS